MATERVVAEIETAVFQTWSCKRPSTREKKAQQEDTIADIEPGVIVRVTGIQAGGFSASKKEITQDEDGVGDSSYFPVGITIATLEVDCSRIGLGVCLIHPKGAR